MTTKGHLYVIEGPDGVGKSTLARALTEHLRGCGDDASEYAFPGNEPGTLGDLVYRLHHDPRSLTVEGFTETARQTLHVAAHADAIERTFLPALATGRSLVLDRFWWSTWVYGIIGGISPDVLQALIDFEKRIWGGAIPDTLFLIDRQSPWRSGQVPRVWGKLRRGYRSLAASERGQYPIARISNARPVEATLATMIKHLGGDSRRGGHGAQSRSNGRASVERVVVVAKSTSLPLFPEETKWPRPSVRLPHSSWLSPAVPTKVFDTYWRFATERQAIFFRKFRGDPPPWTGDEILRRHKFTNAYRASDRVSQYLIRTVIYSGDQSPDEVAFRVLLFKLFNRIGTWELLLDGLGEVTYYDFTVTRYDHVLTEAQRRGETLYSAAYIMPPARSMGSPQKHTGHLRLLDRMMRDDLPARLAATRSLRAVFELLRAYPMLGDFLAYQFAIDLNYSTLMDHSEMEFIVPGPGARSGIRKCFSHLGGVSEADIIRVVTENQRRAFEERGLEFQDLWGRPLQLVDCQNLFCETDKYARVAHPDVKDPAGRERIKQVYRPLDQRIAYWYPPKWGINERIAAEVDVHENDHRPNR